MPNYQGVRILNSQLPNLLSQNLQHNGSSLMTLDTADTAGTSNLQFERLPGDIQKEILLWDCKLFVIQLTILFDKNLFLLIIIKLCIC